MSTTLEDLKGGVSSCCGAKVYLDLSICTDCKEHCGIEQEEAGDNTEDCQLCEGTGEVFHDTWNADAGCYDRGTDVETCKGCNGIGD